jgi:small subunit ribosomal protein S9
MKMAKTKLVQTKAKKKRAIARVRLSKTGKGSYKVNSTPAKKWGNQLAQKVLKLPMSIARDVLGDQIDELDIDVNVNGGGVMGQAEASSVAVAKALVEYSKNDKLKQAYLDYDRKLLVDDVRKKEAKKYLRKGARARRQKSYR